MKRTLNYNMKMKTGKTNIFERLIIAFNRLYSQNYKVFSLSLPLSYIKFKQIFCHLLTHRRYNNKLVS
jgi:hypothetical protein